MNAAIDNAASVDIWHAGSKKEMVAAAITFCGCDEKSKAAIAWVWDPVATAHPYRQESIGVGSCPIVEGCLDFYEAHLFKHNEKSEWQRLLILRVETGYRWLLTSAADPKIDACSKPTELRHLARFLDQSRTVGGTGETNENREGRAHG